MNRNRITPHKIESLRENEIFVFGSNLQGAHEGGAARTARKWGAIMGQGIGIQGQTYAIPTMFRDVKEIKPYVDEFVKFAFKNSGLLFLVTPIGCGIAGFTEEEIAPLFSKVMEIENIHLPSSFWNILNSKK